MAGGGLRDDADFVGEGRYSCRCIGLRVYEALSVANKTGAGSAHRSGE
jgi:hypothetical protein